MKIEDGYLMIDDKHREQLIKALEVENDNRLKNLSYDKMLGWSHHFERAMLELHNNTIKLQTLIWCYEQFKTYGADARSKKYKKQIDEWLPLAIRFPHEYEAGARGQVTPLVFEKRAFDGSFEEFLHKVSAIADSFDLPFAGLEQGYITQGKKFKLSTWYSIYELFGVKKNRDALARRLGIDVPTIPRPVRGHLQAIFKKNKHGGFICIRAEQLGEWVSALEMSVRIKRQQKNILTIAREMYGQDKIVKSIEKNNIWFNPLKGKKDDVCSFLDMMIDKFNNKVAITRDEANKIGLLVDEAGLKNRVIYPFWAK